MTFLAKLQRALLAEDAAPPMRLGSKLEPVATVHLLGVDGADTHNLTLTVGSMGTGTQIGLYRSEESSWETMAVYDGGFYSVNAWNPGTNQSLDWALRWNPRRLDLYCVFLHPVGWDGEDLDVDPRWLTSTVLDFTDLFGPTARDGNIQTWRQGINDVVDRAPILADALMDAGCDNDFLISCLMSPNVHIRIWVVMELHYVVQKMRQATD